MSIIKHFSQGNQEDDESRGFFSRQDLGGEDSEKFHLQLQIANLKREKTELLEALEGLHNYTKNHKDLVGFIKFDHLSKQAEAVIAKAKE